MIDSTDNAAPEINAPAYWDLRFKTDWVSAQGREQTAFFAACALENLPGWLGAAIKADGLSIYDFGCALGDALPLLQHAFPASPISGGDVAPAAIEAARQLYPTFAFDVLSPDAAPPAADVIYCSNTLEHFTDWPERLAALCTSAARYVVMVTPFKERELIDEHVAAFSLTSLPVTAGAMRLAATASFDTARRGNSRWPGRQLIAVYARGEAAVRAAAPQVARDTLILDLRGLSDAEIRAALTAADALDDALSAEVEAHEALKAATGKAEDLAKHFEATAEERGQYASKLAAEFEGVQSQLVEARSYAERQAHEFTVVLKELSDARAYASKMAQDIAVSYTSLAESQRQYFLAKAETNAAEARASAAEIRANEAETRVAAGEAAHASARVVWTQMGLAHNYALDAREEAITADLNAHRATLNTVLSSRSWKLMTRGFNAVAKVRGRTYIPPAMPPAANLTLPRLNVGLLSGGEAVRAALPSPARATGAAPALRAPAQGPRVLITVDELHRGGVEQVVVDLAHGLQDLGCRVAVAVVKNGGDCAGALIQDGVEVIVCEGELAPLTALLSRLSPQIVLANHCYFGWDTMAARGASIVEIVHNYYVWHQADPHGYRGLVAKAAAFAAVSTGVADYHARIFGIDRAAITVINNPINPAGLLRPEPALLRRLRRSAGETFTFVNVAQWYPAKAHAVLMAAFAEIAAAFPGARLELLGQHMDEGVTAAVHAAIEANGLADRVAITGFIDRRTLSRRLASAHAFVQPSVYEGFSVAMAEAAHFALPIIATRVGGALDLIRENDCGIIIAPHIEDFANYTERPVWAAGLMADAPNRAELVEAMRTMIEAREDWLERGFIAQARIDALTPRSVAQRYLDLTAAALAKSSGGAP